MEINVLPAKQTNIFCSISLQVHVKVAVSGVLTVIDICTNFTRITSVFVVVVVVRLSIMVVIFSLEVNWSCDLVGHFGRHLNAKKCLFLQFTFI